MNDRPIAIFDSGIGGLTVVKEVIEQLPLENIVYLGDTARVPYGSRDPETIMHFSLQMLKFLIQENPKAIVVACNTITAICLDAIQDISPVPVIGIIEPTINYALQKTKSGHIGVIGTRATVKSGVYEQQIHSKHFDTALTTQACPLFVPLVEEDWVDHPATKLIVKEYLQPFKNTTVDTFILGCTHYPILSGIISDVLGPNVSLINSGIPTAQAIKSLLETQDLLKTGGEPDYKFYITGAPYIAEKSAHTFFNHKFPGIFEKIVLPQLSTLH